jgi:prepilin-type N-terminal cleavage/methylation domain-containing protein
MQIKLTMEFSSRGFSLIEMAVVLFIVALLLGGLLPTVSSQMEQQHRTETRKQLEEIQQSLIGYAIINGRLPYPAKPSIPTGTLNAGIVDPTLTTGVVPWATLGVKETDAWGRRFTYTATPEFITSNFTLITAGTLTIKNAAPPASSVDIATVIPAIVISHGPNGLGAYTTAGMQVPPVPATNPDEAENSDGLTNLIFVNHDFTPSFDDLMIWITPNILMSRMISANKLP